MLEREYEKYIREQMRLHGPSFVSNKDHDKIKENFIAKAALQTKPKVTGEDSADLSTFLETMANNESYIPHDILFYKIHKKRTIYKSARELIQQQERRKHDIVRLYYHNGIFKPTATSDGPVWSCCMNSARYSQGCCVRSKSTASWNM